MFGYIYETTNLVNGKKYRGKRESKTFILDYYGSGKRLKKAIIKYGRENFDVRIIEKCDNREQLNEREKYWINDLRNNYPPEMIYNIADGGIGGWYYDRNNSKCFGKGSKHTEITKNKMKEHHWSRTGKYDPHTRVYTKEQIDTFKSNHWSKLGYSVWNKGIKIPKEKLTDYQKNFGPICKGTIWIHNENHNKRIKPEDLSLYISRGWVRGRLK